MPKLPTAEAMINLGGLEGDAQRDLQFHGGPARAVCLYSVELIAALRAEGHTIAPGTTGENLTLSGVDWSGMVPGAVLVVGDARLEVTKYAHPCANITGSFADGQIARMSQKVHPGWSRVYARVLAAGRVRIGDVVFVVDSNLTGAP